MKEKILALGVLAPALLPLACASLPVPTAESASWASRQWPGMTLESLQAGRRRYVENCAACHNLHLPSEFPPACWESILEKMQPRAHIDDAQKDLILRYLVTAAARTTAGP